MVCRHCGVSVAGVPHASEHGEYCCEPCFLSAQRRQASQELDSDATAALVETLAAAIDALDAITSDRPYRKGCSFDAASAEILAQCGSQFDPLVLEIFVAEENTLREMVELKCGTVAMQTAPETVLRTPPSQHSGRSVR